MTLDNRQFKLAGTGATQTPTIKNNSSFAFTIKTQLLSTATGTRTLSLGGTGSGLSTFGGKITNGTITTLNLIKADSGTWALSGGNDYNGTTTVSAGTLLINGNQSLATAAVAVNGIARWAAPAPSAAPSLPPPLQTLLRATREREHSTSRAI